MRIYKCKLIKVKFFYVNVGLYIEEGALQIQQYIGIEAPFVVSVPCKI